jgi:hypothetical protein
MTELDQTIYGTAQPFWCPSEASLLTSA